MKKLWGTITHRKDRGKWAIRGTWQGKQLFISQIPTLTGFIPCTSKEMAQHLQLSISQEIENGIFQPARYKKAKPLHLSQYATTWLDMQLAKVKGEQLAYKTYEGYKTYVNRHIIPDLGGEYLPYINHEKIQKFLNGIDLALKTKKHIYKCLTLILKEAWKSGYIKEMPHHITISLPTKKIVWLDDEAFNKVMEKVDPHHRPIIMFMRLTGVRPSEARALRKRDIKKEHIDIVHTFAPVKGKEELKIVKNKREQSIPLYEAVRELFKSMPKNLSNFVFTNKKGTRYSKHIAAQIWNRHCESVLGYKVPLNNVGRHSFGNKLARAGVDMNTISKLLRHTNVAVTKAHYADEDMGVMKSVVDNVQGING